MATTSAILTVSQLNRYVRALLDEQPQLRDIMIRGELADVSYNQNSGHLYFTLFDSAAVLRCAMFSQYASRLKALPQDGLTAVVRGAVSIYERGGQYQLLAYDLQTLGAGLGSAAFEQLKQKLYDEGLFDAARKKPFPALPGAVGVVASADGAALHDIVATMAARNPLVKLVLYPAAAQGAAAAGEIISALDALERDGRCDAVIIARGGGSADDLSVFNDEALVRRAAVCALPVVSAVGHEVDYTLLDYACDARAATPTAACALVCADIEDLRYTLERTVARLHAASPEARLALCRERTVNAARRLTEALSRKVEALAYESDRSLRQLSLLNPAAVLQKGYSLTMKDGAILRDAAALRPGDILATRLRDAEILSAVTEIRGKAEQTDER